MMSLSEIKFYDEGFNYLKTNIAYVLV